MSPTSFLTAPPRDFALYFQGGRIISCLFAFVYTWCEIDGLTPPPTFRIRSGEVYNYLEIVNLEAETKMLYRKLPRVKEMLSVLGFGCMRLPTQNGQIDEAKSLAMMKTALENGVNYVDTARPYHGGKSEPFVGRALKG